MSNTRGELRIRAMRDGETKSVREVMKNAFPFLMRFFFSVTKETFVAEKDGALAGGVVTKTFRINREKKGGLVAFIFTNDRARGLGLGQKLLDHALAYFEEQGCDEMFAAVEGTNTSSSKMFLTRGFALASGGRLIKTYGFNIFRILGHTFHTFDIGHFLWIKPLADYRERPAAQWVVNILLNTVFWTAAYTMREGIALEHVPDIVPSVLIA
ncbi:MAG: GNAT family N-acetyltransferase, partial [Spirochaetales bacterium]|nr:GNAT family N-acetyltransferase [Spirochaetales bacterium]